MNNFALTRKSKNAKTGPIPVSMSTATTCPDSCPLKNAGCYAEGGNTALHWRALNEGARGKDWRSFLDDVATLPEGQLWRHNEAGDLPGRGDAIDGRMAFELVHANKGKRGFTYTHKPMSDAHNRRVVAAMNRDGFAVNLSADDLHEADELAALQIAPVVTVLPSDAPRTQKTPGGRQVVTCPATYSDVTCATCQLCAVSTRKAIVGFPAHGFRKNAINTTLNQGK